MQESKYIAKYCEGVAGQDIRVFWSGDIFGDRGRLEYFKSFASNRERIKLETTAL